MTSVQLYEYTGLPTKLEVGFFSDCPQFREVSLQHC